VALRRGPSREGGWGAGPRRQGRNFRPSHSRAQKFKTQLSQQSLSVQGSGWGWLGYDKTADAVKIVTMPNQDPLSITGLTPLLGIDVWEHAYYLQYKNARGDYLKAIWNVVNFKDVAARLAAAKGTK
jgi:Fe-Mn family superoxide dismutase